MLFFWYCALIFGVATAIVIATIPIVTQAARRYGWVDHPTARKVHLQPMVRLGGVSIFAGTIAASLFGWLLIAPDFNSKIAWVLLGGAAFFVMGVVDDLMGLSALLRLGLQVSISSFVWLAGVQIDFVTIPGTGIVHLDTGLSWLLTILWLTGVVNAINWIDGLDGLASGVSGIAALTTFAICLFMHQPGAALIMIALAGSLLGFLHYNFNPARIFMGDGGSYFIGFTIAGISIVGLTKSAAAVAILLPCLILAVPILDMSAVIAARLYSGKSPFVADKRHLHHRLLNAGLSQRLTVLVIYSLSLWSGSLAIAFVGVPNGTALVASTTGLLSYISWKAWQLAKH
jgi:UDP-GlcNAc:undecaprenyl-phosphate/decaprenyl-phosphate GlcNAc-1-phosphate transferase